MATTMPSDFLVNTSDLKQTRFAPAPAPEDVPLQPGEVLLRIEQFALTSNNITYAAFGEAMNYWKFFPVPPAERGWGRIPVWGFATVARLGPQAPEGLALGERLYGYLPMSSWLVVKPVGVNAQGFSDGAAHRAGLHPVYNQLRRCAADPTWRPEAEARQMLVQPLFMTAWLIDDFLADQAFLGARQVILSSASSKTAYSLAHQLKMRQRIKSRPHTLLGSGADGQGTLQAPAVRTIGLTAQANAVFVNALGCYDRVLSYDELATLDPKTPSVYVDMAGNGALRRAVHEHFGASLAYSCSVGGTHWDALAPAGAGQDLPGPRPALFFAPAQIKKRSGEWGGAVLQQRMGQAWLDFLPQLEDWMHVLSARGEVAVRQVYQALLLGQGKPDQGYVLSL